MDKVTDKSPELKSDINPLLTWKIRIFKLFCGTDPLPELFRAKRYKIHQKFLTKEDFQFIMRNLPVKVAEEDIEDMFAVADTDNDGKLGYKARGNIIQTVP